MIDQFAKLHQTRTFTCENIPTARLPLYLCMPEPVQIDTDGPAFVVKRRDQAPTRYPFSRVARIIAGRNVAWTTGAITACLEQDIPVVFLDRTRTPAGYLQSRQRQPSRLDGAIAELLDRPDGLEYYAQWLRAERMRILTDWRKNSESGQQLSEDAFRLLIHRHVYQQEDPLLEFATAELIQSAVYAYALQQVQRCGARPLYWGYNARPLHLANDLATLLMLQLYLEMYGLGRSIHGSDAVLLTILHQFLDKLKLQSQIHLGSLHKHVREVLDLWL